MTINNEDKIIFQNKIIQLNGTFLTSSYTLPNILNISNKVIVSFRDSNNNNIVGLTQSSIYNNIASNEIMRSQDKFILGSSYKINTPTYMTDYSFNLPKCNISFLLNNSDFSNNILLYYYHLDGYCKKGKEDIDLYKQLIDFSHVVNYPQSLIPSNSNLNYSVKYTSYNYFKLFKNDVNDCNSDNVININTYKILQSEKIYIRDILSVNNSNSISDFSFNYKITDTTSTTSTTSTSNFYEPGTIKFSYLLNTNKYSPSINRNIDNKIVFYKNSIKICGQFLDSTNNLGYNTTTFNNENNLKNLILLSYRKNTHNAICLTRSNLFNNVLNDISDNKIILQSYNRYSQLNSYNIDISANNNYLFNNSITSLVPSNSPDTSFITYGLHYFIIDNINNSNTYPQIDNELLSFNLQKYSDFSYIFNKYSDLCSNNISYYLTNSSASAFNQNLKISNSTFSDIIGNKILDTDSNLNITNIVANVPVQFQYSLYNNLCRQCYPIINSDDFLQLNNVTIFNYYPEKYSIFAYNIETIYDKEPLGGWNSSDISNTTLLASNIYYTNPFTGSQSYYFDGSSIYYNIYTTNKNILKGDYTISLWINCINDISDLALICFNDISNTGNSSQVSLTYNGSNTFTYRHNQSSNVFTFTKKIEKDEWIHLAITQDTNRRVINSYINGKFDSSYNFNSNIITVDYNEIILGCNIIDENKYFKGQMTDIYIFDTCLISSDIIYLYNNVEKNLYNNIFITKKPIVTYRSIYQDTTFLDYYIIDNSNLVKLQRDGNLYITNPDAPGISHEIYGSNSGHFIELKLENIDVNTVKMVPNDPSYGDYTEFNYFVERVSTLTNIFSDKNDSSSNIAFSSYIFEGGGKLTAFNAAYSCNINDIDLVIKLKATDSFYNDPSSKGCDGSWNKAYQFYGNNTEIQLTPLRQYAPCYIGRNNNCPTNCTTINSDCSDNVLTIAFWIYHKRINYNWEECIISLNDSINKLFVLFHQLNNFIGEIRYKINENEVLISSPIEYYTWYHIAIVHDKSNNVVMYKNNIIDSSFSYNYSSNELNMELLPDIKIIYDEINNNKNQNNIDLNNFWLGCKSENIKGNKSNFFSGEIKSLYVFNECLSHSNISRIYNYDFCHPYFFANHNPIFDWSSFDTNDELTYFVNSLDGSSNTHNEKTCDGRDNIIINNLLIGNLLTYRRETIIGTNYNIDEGPPPVVAPFRNWVYFEPLNNGTGTFTFYVKEEQTDRKSNIATVTITVYGILNCFDTSNINNQPVYICENNSHLTYYELKLKQKSYIGSNNRDKLTKKQIYSRIASKGYNIKYIKRCPKNV